MKILEFDWLTLCGPIAAWGGLAVSSRGLLQKSFPGTPFQLADFGSADGPALVRAKVLKPYADGLRAAPTEEARPFLALLRLLHRAPILAHPTHAVLRAYLTEIFNAEERSDLTRRFGPEWCQEDDFVRELTRGRHLQSFRDARDLGKWELGSREREYRIYGNDRLRFPARFADPALANEARRLAERLVAQPGPIPFLDLWTDSKSRELVAPAALGLVRYGLAFLAVNPVDGVIVLSLWPAVSARLHREPPPAPRSITPSPDRSTAFGVQDLEQLIVDVAREPLKVRAQDGLPYEKRRRELQAAQRRQNAVLTEFHSEMHSGSGWRTLFALENARLFGWLELALAWTVTHEARTWLQLRPAERHKWILDALRNTAERKPVPQKQAKAARVRAEPPNLVLVEDELDPNFDAESDWDDDPPFQVEARRNELTFLSPLQVDVRIGSRSEKAQHVVAAFADLPVGEFFDVGKFLKHRTEVRCPRVSTPKRSGQHELDPELLEAHWSDMLLAFLHTRLLPFGAAVASDHGEGRRPAFALTPLAAYLFGTTEEWPGSSAGAEEKLVIVQPNFDIVFPSAAPGIESQLVAFADRRGDQERTILRITRSSVSRAANAGLDADAMITALTEASLNPIPRNVEREIRGWAAATLALAVEEVTIVRCGDADAALRLVAEAGGGARLIGTTVVELPSGKKLTELVRKLRAQGVFLTTPSERPRPRSRR